MASDTCEEANPCEDTLSITRLGDTIPMDHFDWMVAEFDNNTSVVPTLVQLYLHYNGSVEVAEPDFLLQTFSTTPCDPIFDSVPQKSLIMMGMPFAWDYDVGDDSVLVAVVDHGIDYWRCDLGGGIGAGHKVIGGWRYHWYHEGMPPDTTYHGPGQNGIY